jgi:alpha-tubulin suppressor-like RCC1 family protein
LTASGTVYVWGLGDVGQLGNGGVEGSVTPVPVQGIGTVNSIASGAKHMLALTSGGLYAWGDNTWGQLGIGSAEMATSPTLIQGLPNDIVAIGAGPNHSAAVTQSGEVWAWGSNSDGQIGNNAGGAGQVVGLPYRVTGLPDQARAVAAGSSFTLALLKDGTVQVWGANVSGAFGDGTLSGSSVPVPGIAPGEGVTAVACGFSHALAITQSGKVLAWGSNDAGELGIQSSDSHSLTPVEVTGHSGKAVSGAGHSSMLIDADGKLFGWGDNAFGILGDGTVQARRAPVLIHSDPAVRAVALGSVHGIMAAGANGQVYTWGPNLYGELGYPAATWLPGHRTAIDLGEFPVADPDDDEDPGNGPGDGDPSGEPVGGDGPGGGNGNGLNPGDGSSGGGGRGGSGSDGDAGQGGGNSGAGNLDAGSAAPGVDGGGATARPDGPGGSARAATPGIARFAVSFTTVVIRPGESVKVPVAADGVRAGLKGKAAVTWTSSRPSTATLAGAKKSGKATWQVGKVKSVTVRGLKTGTSRIVLSSPGARKLVLRVRVVPASGARAIEAVALRVKGGTPASRSTLRVGETAGLKAWPVPLGAIRAKATWTSSNRSVAIVDAAGRVTATGPGKAVIACRVHGETTSLTIKVR